MLLIVKPWVTDVGMSQLLEFCYCYTSESQQQRPTQDEDQETGISLPSLQHHPFISAITTLWVKAEAGWLTLFLSVHLALLDPTRYNICSKYSLILAVHSGSKRCVGHLLLSLSGATSVFLFLAYHISPTRVDAYQKMQGSGFGRQVLGRGVCGFCEPGSPLLRDLPVTLQVRKQELPSLLQV